MRSCLFLLVSLALVVTVGAQDDAAPSSDDQTTIEKAAIAFVEAYNQQDVAGIASLFAEDAELIERDGTTFVGREEIGSAFAEVFELSPQGKISLSVESIRFVTPDVAVEEGVSVWYPDGETATTESTYRVAHVRRDGGWLMISARTIDDRLLSNYEHLRDLEWMVGEWIDESDEAVVETTVRWTDNRAFLVREFKVKIAGSEVLSGTQRIGWDHRNKQFRSWLFDSEGGFVEGVWTLVDGGYVIRSSGSLNDGTPVSGTTRVERENDDRFTWSMFNRLRGNEIMPDVDVTIVRKPPQPAIASN